MPKFHLLPRSFSFLFASALAIGTAFPLSLVNADSAKAAEFTNFTVTSTGPLTAGQANSAPIVITFTSPTAMPAVIDPNLNNALTNRSHSAYVSLVGTSALNPPSDRSCTGTVTVQNDQGLSTNCSLFDSPNVSTQAMGGGGAVDWPAGTTWTFTYAANTVTLPYAATINVSASTFLASSPPTTFDSARLAVPLVGYVAQTKTVTFDANGGEGNMASQVASSATALTSNSFARSGFSFSGWNTLANGTGTAFADAASFAFATDQTLYAQWTAIPVVSPVTADPKLAVTGTPSDSFGLWSSSALMITAGLGLLLVVQLRVRSQGYIYATNKLSRGAWKNYLSLGGHN